MINENAADGVGVAVEFGGTAGGGAQREGGRNAGRRHKCSVLGGVVIRLSVGVGKAENGVAGFFFNHLFGQFNFVLCLFIGAAGEDGVGVGVGAHADAAGL